MAQSKHLDDLGAALKSVIQKALLKTGKINLTDEPQVKKNDLIEYERRMLASGLEKFNGPAYVCGLSFFKSEKERETNAASGACVLYLAEEFVETLLKALGQTAIDDAPEEEMAQKCGEFHKTLVEEFKSDLSRLGYGNLITSEIFCGRNTLPLGVYFGYDQFEKCEITFTLKTAKILVAEITMTAKK